jgi:peptide/nickel transport system ATP-binding protein
LKELDVARNTDALRIEHLDVVYRTGRRERRVLSDLSLTIRRGESYGLVGESGCGKSTAALAAIRYLARNGRVSAGRILLDGHDLMALSPGELRRVRPRSVAMVYQDPTRALNPTLRIGRQMSEVFELAEGLSGPQSQERAGEMLARVQIANPGRVLRNFPHELSGGMQQRVVIAMALSTNPALLILDEPTTGLDATVEADVLELVSRLHTEFDNAILFISHSLPTVARLCDRVGVLYAGELVEETDSARLFTEPRHPYTVALLRCIPAFGRRKSSGSLDSIPGHLPEPGSIEGRCVFAERCANADERCRSEAPPLEDLGAHLSRCWYPDKAPLLPRATAASRELPAVLHTGQPTLRVTQLSKTYWVGEKPLQAVHEVNFDLWPGETLGLVGESGSGKSTLAKLLLGLTAADDGGRIELAGEVLPPDAADRSLGQLKALQIVFQNPGAALNRSQTVRRLLGRSLRLLKLSGARRESRLRELAASVRLTERHLGEKPRQLSGGLKQRVGIARAFAGEPRVVVCDEPTSALDVSVQAAILNLLVELQADRRGSYVFISHDLNVVQYLADRIAVMYLGRLLEIGPAPAVFSGPQHPYTAALLSANPAGEGHLKRTRLPGELPGALNLPTGCVFQTRCPCKLGRICEEQEPGLMDAGEGHSIRCHIPAVELMPAPRSASRPPDTAAPSPSDARR